MKRKKYLLLLSLILATSCKIEKGVLQKTIFVASDLHLLSNNLISDDNQTYLKKYLTGDGRVQEYDYDLIEEFVKQININKPEYVMITGDLTLNGEKDSHLELIKLLSNINDDTKALIVPGNHDICNVNSMSYVNDAARGTQNVNYDEFRQLYKDFGYQGAYSYDPNSLSYIYDLNDNLWALMLDDNISFLNEDFDYNNVGGYVLEETLEWIEDNLKVAKEKNIKVISFMHHNLLLHNSMFDRLYRLGNASEVLDLYSKYNVNLNFSGHLHIQSIKDSLVNKQRIYEVVNSSLLDYGNHYGKLDIYDNCFDYSCVDLSIFDNFMETSYQVFYDKYYYKNEVSYELTYQEDYKKVLDFAAKINCYYFDGDYEKIRQEMRNNRKIVRKIKKQNNAYIKSILDVEDKSQKSLLIGR